LSLSRYIETVNNRYRSGIASEHAYRGDLEALIRELVLDVDVTNEPSKVTECGNPDYVITKKNIPIGFIEAKDIGKDLNSKTYKEQFDRYRKALDNLIITDYLWFRFYQSGELVHEIRVADIQDGNIIASPECFDEFTGLVQNFCTYIGNTIKFPKKLASMMAAKARLLQVILEKAITSDEQTQDNTALQQQFKTFKDVLIHDLKPAAFADIYAQTLTYGMFAARLHDKTLHTFSRQEAAELIPKSNPFLRKLFNHVAGADIDERIKTTVDNLADVFRATDVKALLKNFGRATQTHDPIIHFYETFLAEYDPKLRKARGVWYTPEPVVNFIVRGVDEILKTEFGLKDGLADTSKTKIKLKKASSDKRKVLKGQRGYMEVEEEVHKVQVLDPATGTGTFLAEVVKFIYHGKFAAMQGAWSSYVDEHLIPRLNGFELLMASYAMAHLKLDMLLRETGFVANKEQRLNIYLTNSLEEHHPDTGTLFSSWLSSEANEANHIKRDTPVMVVMGNPPYSGESANKGDWIMKLMEDYKKEPGGKEKLKERNPKWINDDYVKFMRYGQHFIEKNGEGILAFINPHGFLDNPTFRGMRWNLLKTYDKIYTIDLHGNSKKKEVSPDGSKDVNVFDIQQGVSINFLIKTGKNKINDLAEVRHFDLYGERGYKYDLLFGQSLQSIPFILLPNVEPMYFMVQKDFESEKKYSDGFSVQKLFSVSVLGFQSHRDHFAVAFTRRKICERIADMRNLELSNDLLRRKYNLSDNRDWQLAKARKQSQLTDEDDVICDCSYRPFDTRPCYFSYEAMDYPRRELMGHVAGKDNLCLNVCRQTKVHEWKHALVSSLPTPAVFVEIKDGSSVMPLYLYPEEGSQKSLGINRAREPNLDAAIVEVIAKGLNLTFVPEKNPPQSPCAGGRSSVADAVKAPLLEKEGLGDISNTFAPIDLLDYIYAILHSPTYRKTYKEFLKIDFPRIPYPKDVNKFWRLVALGGELRQIHLLESPVVEHFITSYPENGDHIITRKITKTSPGYEPTSDTHGKVWINDSQYFDKVPLVAWEFFIGGYQPAQKWLKDRIGRKLSFDDILHYQKIIVALTETDRIMQDIDKVDLT